MKINEKLLRVAISSVLLGRPVPFNVKGTKEELTFLSSALYETKRFHDEVQNPDATVKSLVEALQRKHNAVHQFEKAFNVSWPL